MNDEVFTFDDAVIEAEEDFVIDAQFLIQELMNEHGLTRADLAKKLGVSRARLTQMMKPDANPTLRLVARVACALGEKVRLRRSDPVSVVVENPSSLIWNEIMSVDDHEGAVGDAASTKVLRPFRVHRHAGKLTSFHGPATESCHNDNGGWVSSSVLEVAA